MTKPPPGDYEQATGHNITSTARCRVMQTRTCPQSHDGPCEDQPCARFETDDPTPWETHP